MSDDNPTLDELQARGKQLLSGGPTKAAQVMIAQALANGASASALLAYLEKTIASAKKEIAAIEAIAANIRAYVEVHEKGRK